MTLGARLLALTATGGLGVLLAVGFIWATSSERVRTFSVGGMVLEGRIANSSGEWQQGLSGTKPELPLANKTMLFIFPQRMVRTFWMKDMLFPLDIYWFAGEDLVGVSRGVEPPRAGEEPVTVVSEGPVDRVLEVPAGTTLNF